MQAGIVSLEQLLPYMATNMDQLAQQAAGTLEAALVDAGVTGRAAAAVKEEPQKEAKEGGSGAVGAAAKRWVGGWVGG
jgi:hypothetical protein